MSPADISLLLHCYAFNEPIPMWSGREPAHMKDWVEQGIVTRCDEPGVYKTTPLGNAWVEALMRVERPRMAYIAIDGSLLKIVDGP